MRYEDITDYFRVMPPRSTRKRTSASARKAEETVTLQDDSVIEEIVEKDEEVRLYFLIFFVHGLKGSMHEI